MALLLSLLLSLVLFFCLGFACSFYCWRINQALALRIGFLEYGLLLVEASILAVSSLLWFIFLTLYQVKQLGLNMVIAVVGVGFGAIAASVYEYYTDTTGKGRYTLRNLYTLIAIARILLYGIFIVLGGFIPVAFEVL